MPPKVAPIAPCATALNHGPFREADAGAVTPTGVGGFVGPNAAPQRMITPPGFAGRVGTANVPSFTAMNPRALRAIAARAGSILRWWTTPS